MITVRLTNNVYNEMKTIYMGKTKSREIGHYSKGRRTTGSYDPICSRICFSSGNIARTYLSM